jgi:hypothetical protein
VKQLSRGQLKLSTDDAGTVYIEWDKIVAVTTALQYEVVTTNGARYVGVLAQASTTQLKVVANDGTETVLAFLDVVSFASIKARFLERIDGTLDVGGSYTKSSGVGQMAVDFNADYRRPSYDVFTNFESNLSRSSSETITQFTLRSGYMRFRADGWIFSPVDAVASIRTSLFRHDYPRTAVDLSLLTFPELNRWGRVRANANARLKQPTTPSTVSRRSRMSAGTTSA